MGEEIDPEAGQSDLDLDLAMWLISLERWWTQTSNPLYAREAIARCLNAIPPAPVPKWCVPYLAEVATNITHLSWRAVRREMPSERAAKKVGGALKVVRQGANAFAQAQKDADAMRYARRAENEPKKGGVFETIVLGQKSAVSTTEPWAGRTMRKIRQERNIETSHAAKAILRRGRKLIGLDQTS
jgi:hypothetical protein